MFPSNNQEDWALEGGFAPFEMSGQKAVALLYTISGYGKMVNVMILTNSQAYEASITAFVESISLKSLPRISTRGGEGYAAGILR